MAGIAFDLRVSGFYKLSTICKLHAVIKVNFMKKLAPSLCFVAGGISLVQQELARMDLTSSVSQVRKFEPVSGSSGGTGIGSGVAESSYRAKPLFELKLMNVQTSKNSGDLRVVYEVEIKNVSDAVVRIPWDPSPRDIEPSPPRAYEYELASLRLELPRAPGENQRFESVSIYGSEESHTLQTLSPGEWVRIRAEAKLKTLNGDFTEEGKVSMVRATWNQYKVTVDGSPSQFHETLTPEGTQIQSRNALPVPNDLSNEK